MERGRQQRNLLATIPLSHGVALLLGGDELGRSPGANNNGYCQFNEVPGTTGPPTTRGLLEASIRGARRAASATTAQQEGRAA